MNLSTPSEPKIYSVSAITAVLKDRLEDIPRVVVEGEVSNFKPAGNSRHLYFTLGDEGAKLGAVFFAFNQVRQGEIPEIENGGRVRVTGRFTLYAPSGAYRISVEHLELCDGEGDLRKRFEALKAKLTAEGLCDPSRKRPLPLLPKRIGIVTSPTGAAIRDILQVLNRRYPNLHIIISPCRVQGAEAVEEIAQAIEKLNRHFGPDSEEPLDAMIVGRGGGSLEDLWCFNEERVARAVVASRIPVISAVGHEPDVAITDFVADIRAATPSVAAEIICGKKEDLETALYNSKQRLLNALRMSYRNARDRVQAFERNPILTNPTRALETLAQQIESLNLRLAYAQESRLTAAGQHIQRHELALERLGAEFFPKATQRLADINTRLLFAVNRAVENAAAGLHARELQLEAYNPLAVLQRGYALVTTPNGKTVTTATTLTSGDDVTLRFADGTHEATIR